MSCRLYGYEIKENDVHDTVFCKETKSCGYLDKEKTKVISTSDKILNHLKNGFVCSDCGQQSRVIVKNLSHVKC